MAYKGAIDVLAFSFGSSNSGTLQLGPGGGAGKGVVEDLSVTKFRDSCSPELFLSTLNGEQFARAQLDVRTTGSNPLVITSIILEPVLVTSVNSGGSSGEDRLIENLTLDFSKITIKEFTIRDDGTRDETPAEICWDLVSQQPCP